MAKEVDLIKEKLPVLDFLRSYIAVTPAGRNFRALCPFHPEKTPSFIISPDRGRWHCFGCGEGGDVITFVMKYENLEFPEALRFLAERAGITLPSLNPQYQREFGVLYDANEAAKDFFTTELLKNPAALEYLTSRGLNTETLKDFSLGYAPGGDTMTLALIKKGFDVNDIARAGLAYKTARGLFRDRFERRIMFPLANHVGKTVAFTGRIFGPQTMPEGEIPKYMNSPETPIFNKSRMLYGLHKSKIEVARAKAVVVVEGQMDFLMLWQCGVRNAVAVSGTGFTEYHLERLRRLADTVYASFDNDAAGLKAMERMLAMLSPQDFHVKVLQFGSYKDPAEALQKEPDYMKGALEKAVPAFQFLFKKYFSAEMVRSDLALKKRVVAHMLELILLVANSIERSEWMRELASASSISENALREEFEKLEEKKGNTEKEKEAPRGADSLHEDRTERIAKRLLALAFTNEALKGIISENKEYMPKVFSQMLEHPEAESAELFQMQSSYLFGTADEKDVRNECYELIKQLKLEYFKREQDDLKRSINAAEKSGDEAKFLEAMGKFQELSKKMNELKSQ
ncbi:MAG: DNA primase [Candidatus Paceibacterota bacterium]|jgi:DNA primase